MKDLEAIYEQISDLAIIPDVKFAHIYNNKKTEVMAALEERITDILVCWADAFTW